MHWDILFTVVFFLPIALSLALWFFWGKRHLVAWFFIMAAITAVTVILFGWWILNACAVVGGIWCYGN